MITSKKKRDQSPNMAACVFLAILAIVFALNIFIRLPIQKAIRISDEGITCLESPGRQWFVLEGDDYTVGECFETESQRSSAIPLLSKKFFYYTVTVVGKDSDAGFTMPVRVKTKKAQQIERREKVALYGMISRIDQNVEQSAKQRTQSPMCLNDNGATPLTRSLSALVFAVLTAVCVWFIVLILKRS